MKDFLTDLIVSREAMKNTRLDFIDGRLPRVALNDVLTTHADLYHHTRDGELIKKSNYGAFGCELAMRWNDYEVINDVCSDLMEKVWQLRGYSVLMTLCFAVALFNI